MRDFPFDGLIPFSYDVIVSDPPWSFELYSEEGDEKSAGAQYDLMSLDEIIALPVGHLAQKDCLLLLWVCEWMKPGDHQRLLDHWGFEYKSSIVWPKGTKNGKLRMGPGYRVRTRHERIILATMGNPKHKAFHSIIPGLAREHSRKPDEFYDAVLKATPHAERRLEMFARQSRPGFDAWGNQSTLFDTDIPVDPKQVRKNSRELLASDRRNDPQPDLWLNVAE